MRAFWTRRITRRTFCSLCLTACAGLPVGVELLSRRARAASGGPGFVMRREAMFYHQRPGGGVQCDLCPFRCVLTDGTRGVCRVRGPQNGVHYTFVWANPTAVHADPIEKKPLYHFLPGTQAFSIATAGCNFRCKNCQNWSISQFPPEETVNESLPPEAVVSRARREDCRTIAYTYTEPSVFYEYMLQTARIAREQGVRNMYHSNGFLNKEPLAELCRYLDAADIDLKSFREDFYTTMTGGSLQPVLDTITALAAAGVHLEITNLIIPGLNDSDEEVCRMYAWIARELGPDVPIHVARCTPMYQLRNTPPTPLSTLERVRRRAQEAGLRYVYLGNVPGHPAESTGCPSCGAVVIGRFGYRITSLNLKQGACGRCGYRIAGVWQ